MKKRLQAAMAAMAALGLIGSLSLHAQTGPTAPATTHNATKAVSAPKPSLLAEEPVSQQAKTDASAPTTSSSAMMAENKANTAPLAAAPQSMQTQTGSAAPTTASDMTVADMNKKVDDLSKEVNSPDAIHYKGIAISPGGSFIEAATVYRNAATGGDINTPFTSIPLEHSGEAQIGEFKGSGRQSRIALKADGKLDNVDMTAYYEMDWLGTGIASNNNQSNSYVVRMRQLWARAAFTNGWNVSGGQMWSLATETAKGLDNGSEILPGTIDPQYTAGYVWERQYGFRVAKDYNNKFWMGASLENAQAQAGGSGAANEFLGSSGVGGGLYNSTATYSFNEAPDMIVKIAAEPGWGHWELFGLARVFENRVYPATGSPYNDTVVGGGVGGGFRGPLFNKKLSIGLKGLYGDGTGRYGNAQLGDLTFRTDGTMSLLHAFSALGTVEATPTKKLSVYLNYGGDYVGRDIQDGGTSGYGLRSAIMTGCNTEATATGGATTPTGTGTCAGNNKDVQEFTSGYWYNFYNGPKGRFRYGLQYSYIERNLWSGAGAPLNPGGGAKGTDNIFETSLRYYLP